MAAAADDPTTQSIPVMAMTAGQQVDRALPVRLRDLAAEHPSV
jgi:hypothetical protein